MQVASRDRNVGFCRCTLQVVIGMQVSVDVGCKS